MFGFSLSLFNRESQEYATFIGIHADSHEAMQECDKQFPTPPHDLGNGIVRYPLRSAFITRNGETFPAQATIAAGCLLYVRQDGSKVIDKCKIEGTDTPNKLNALVCGKTLQIEFVVPPKVKKSRKKAKVAA